MKEITKEFQDSEEDSNKRTTHFHIVSMIAALIISYLIFAAITWAVSSLYLLTL